jgi:outer membrane protein assembly factor BamA
MRVKGKKYSFFTILCICCSCFCLAQEQKTADSIPAATALEESQVFIRKINIVGNRKTKPHIVKREVPLEEGKGYPMSLILSSLQTGRQNLMNTALFVDVSLEFTNWYNDSLDVVVDVKERWYYFPFPIFKPVDRNWNVWISQNNVSLERVNYGLKFLGANITGRNDKLNLYLVNGYTRSVAITYENPFVGYSLKHGLSFEVSYGKNREVNYTTRENQQVFYKNEEDFVRTKFMFGVGYSYRKGSIERHTVKVNYTHEEVADTVAELNPKFLGDGNTSRGFPELMYRYQYLGVNYIPYPTKGFRWDFTFVKRGLAGEMNMTMVNIKAAKHWPLPYKFFYSIYGEGTVKFPFDQPFYNQQLMGYGDNYLRGLEYYVIDGVAGGIIRNTIRKQVLDVRVKTGLKSRTYGSIPFKVFLKAYGDVGYSYNKNNVTGNYLTNKFLYTGGFGIDILTIYDVVFKLEYSFNQFNERALFVHMNEF